MLGGFPLARESTGWVISFSKGQHWMADFLKQGTALHGFPWTRDSTGWVISLGEGQNWVDDFLGQGTELDGRFPWARNTTARFPTEGGYITG